MGWHELTERVAATVVNTFKTTATYDPVTGSNFSINGVFDAAHTELAILDGAEVQSVFPAFFVANADLPATPIAGDRITVNSVLYRVAERRPDGEAGTLLVLNKI